MIFKHLEKNQATRKSNINNKSKRENHQKKIRFLERKIEDLEKQLVTLKRKFEFCPHCHISIS